MRKTLKKIAHIALFLVAIIVFYLGLGIGLTANPTLGTALWVVAIAIAVANLYWLLRGRLRQQ